MKKIIFDQFLRTPNVFPKEIRERLSVFGNIIGGMFIFNSPKMDEFIAFCKKNNYFPVFKENYTSFIESISTVSAYYEEGKFIIKFRSKFSPPITLEDDWKKIAEPMPYKNMYAFYYYPFLIALRLLKREGYTIDLSDDLKFLEEDENTFSEMPEPRIIGNWEPFNHQIEGSEKIVRNGGKGIIGDEAGLGKSITAMLVISKLYEKMPYKRGIWVVPTIPLVYQVAEEIRDRFGIPAFPITSTIGKKERLGLGYNQSVYEAHPIIVLTWATFRKDWTENLKKVWHIKFGFAVFDEIHTCRYGNKTYEAALNFPSDIRIGLTGTPAPNGKWNEMRDIIYVTDPLKLPPISEYIKREKKILKTYYEHPLEGEPPEKTAERVMNKITNAQLSKMIVRHTRSSLNRSLPKIIEIDPIHVPLDGTEDFIVETLFDMLVDIISLWSRERDNFILDYAKSMVWQDLRRFCAYGGKYFKKRIDALLVEKTSVYEYIRTLYKHQIVEMDRILSTSPITDYPKFPILLDNIIKIPHHHVVIFCDSVLTSIDLGEFLHDHGFDVKVVTGAINKKTLFEGIPTGNRDDEMERIEGIFRKLNQPITMNENDVQKILEWFWSPYMPLSNLSEQFEVFYSIDGNEWEGYCYYVNMRKAKKISIKIPNYVSLTRRQKNHLKEIENEIREIDPSVSIIEEGGDRIFSFKNGNRQKPKVLVTTNKLSEGCNLQIAQSIVFFDQPISIREREQRLARIHRIGSPYNEIYLMPLVCGIEYAIIRVLKEKYEYVEKMEFSRSKSLPLREIINEMRKIRKRRKKWTLDSFSR